MSRQQNFVDTVTIVHDFFLNDMQEVLSGLAVNCRLEQQSGTSVRIVAGSGGDQTSIVINGQLRFATVTKTLTMSGSVGTYNIFATADTSDTDFALVATTAASPVGVTNYRKIGTVPWSGTAINGDVVNLAGSAPTNSPTFTGTPSGPTAAVGTRTTQLATTDFVSAAIPVGAIWMTAAAAVPAGSDWVMCDGTSYTTAGEAALFAAIGYKYGGSGANFNVPNFKGRTPVGAGTGAGDGSTGAQGSAPSGTALTARALGDWGGKQAVALTTTQMPAHNHQSTIPGGNTTSGSTDVGHSHSVSITTNGTGITTYTSSGYTPSAGAAFFAGSGATFTITGSGTAAGNSLPHTHTFTISTEGGGATHENMAPWLAVNFMIKRR